jgi:hypothetical protein
MTGVLVLTLCYPDSPPFRSLLKIIPHKEAFSFMNELIMERSRVMIIDKDKGLPLAKSVKGVEDERMPLPWDDIYDIEFLHIFPPFNQQPGAH